MPNSITVGKNIDCDRVVDVPSVSGRHCRLTRHETEIEIEDLNSTNGTFFNGRRIVGSARVTLTPSDTIHLGSHLLDHRSLLDRLSADREEIEIRVLGFSGQEMEIGRQSGCDIVIDLPTVSSRHARLTRTGADVLLEDLGSANGTFIDGRRITSATVLPPGSVIALGSSLFRLSRESWPSPPSIAHHPLPQTGLIPYLSPGQTDLQSTSTTSRRHAASAVAVLFFLALAPLPLLLGVWAVGESSAFPLFGLAVAVPAFGVLDALLSPRFAGVLNRGKSSTPRLTFRLFIVAALCLVQCFIAWYPSRWLAGLDAAGLPGLLVLYIAALGGAAMGFLTLALTPDAAYARPVVFVVFTVLCALAGGLNPTLRDQRWMKPISAVAPSRWAFEGLILLESGEAGSQAIDEATAHGRRTELAERYFPAASERMGLVADCVSLMLILVGLGAAAAFCSPSLTEAGAHPAGEPRLA